MTKLNSYVKSVGPTEAAQYLANNTMNRHISHAQVLRYVKLMREEKWKLIPAPLILSKEGILLQGQHRLNAIVNSGTTQEFLICEGVDKSIFSLLDAGMGRSGSDVLYTYGGFTMPELTSSMAYNQIRYDNGSFWGKGNKAIAPMNDDILEFAIANKDSLCSTINFVLSIKGRTKYFSQVKFASACHIIIKCTKKKEEEVHEFFRAIFSEDEFKGCEWLRDQMSMDKASARKLQWKQVYASIFYAWNAWTIKKFIPVNPENLKEIEIL